MGIIPRQYDLGKMTTTEVATLREDAGVVVLLPVGSVEPHGPHLGLATDTIISVGAAARACAMLEAAGTTAVVAPSVPYGVTECAARFAGAVTVSAESLTRFLSDVAAGFLRNGFAHVCLINNHLEPEHDAAVHAVRDVIDDGRVSVACPLKRRWARTLSDEFKSGACHAGKYESSIIKAVDATYIDTDQAKALPTKDVSLSEKLSAGVTDFVEMGLTDAYTGDPAAASAEHGEEQVRLLATMVCETVTEAMSDD